MNILLLRGLGREAGHWGDFPAKLASLDHIHEVKTLDLPGVGSELHQASPNSIAKIVEDVRGRFDDEGKKWGVIAISLGAMVAMEWVRQAPEQFQIMVAMNTSAGKVSKRFERVQKHALKEFLRIFSLNDVVARERAILDLTSASEEGRARALESWVQIARERPIARATLVSQLWAASRFKAQKLAAIPMLFMASENDGIVQPRCTKDLAKFHAGELKVHDTAGHDLPLDAPEWTLSTIQNFLNEKVPLL